MSEPRRSDQGPRVRPIPWWALASAGTAPVFLIGGWTLAQARQPPRYNPIRDTISALAAHGATDRWVMTAGLFGLGACHVITAAGLGPVRRRGRAVLALGGGATLLVATFAQPAQGNSVAHTVAAAAGLRRPRRLACFRRPPPEPGTAAEADGVVLGHGRAPRIGGVVRGRDPWRPAWAGRARRSRCTGTVAAGGRRHHPSCPGPHPLGVGRPHRSGVGAQTEPARG